MATRAHENVTYDDFLTLIFDFLDLNVSNPEELNWKPNFALGTNPGTKLVQVLSQELNTYLGTKSSSSGTKLRTLTMIPTSD